MLRAMLEPDAAIRVDPVTGTPVLVVPDRQGRPNRPEEGCPFCVGGLEAPDPYQVRSFPNRWPAMGGDRCEVVLYSPDHSASLASLDAGPAARLVELWAERTRALGDRPDVGYVLIFENRGAAAGATIDHPHGQVYAYADVPPVPARELECRPCPFCVRPAEELVVSRADGWTTSVPWAAGWPYEMLLAPDAHLPDLPAVAADPDLVGGLAGGLTGAARRLDLLFGAPMPYMLWIHQRPTDGGVWETAHLHFHLCPLWRDDGVVRYMAAAEQGGGVLFNPVEPSRAAERLRRAGR